MHYFLLFFDYCVRVCVFLPLSVSSNECVASNASTTTAILYKAHGTICVCKWKIVDVLDMCILNDRERNSVLNGIKLMPNCVFVEILPHIYDGITGAVQNKH